MPLFSRLEAIACGPRLVLPRHLAGAFLSRQISRIRIEELRTKARLHHAHRGSRDEYRRAASIRMVRWPSVAMADLVPAHRVGADAEVGEPFYIPGRGDEDDAAALC